MSAAGAEQGRAFRAFHARCGWPYTPGLSYRDIVALQAVAREARAEIEPRGFHAVAAPDDWTIGGDFLDEAGEPTGHKRHRSEAVDSAGMGV